MLARYVVEDNEVVISESGKQNADVNHSGTPDQQDVVLILKYIARLITAF